MRSCMPASFGRPVRVNHRLHPRPASAATGALSSPAGKMAAAKAGEEKRARLPLHATTSPPGGTLRNPLPPALGASSCSGGGGGRSAAAILRSPLICVVVHRLRRTASQILQTSAAPARRRRTHLAKLQQTRARTPSGRPGVACHGRTQPRRSRNGERVAHFLPTHLPPLARPKLKQKSSGTDWAKINYVPMSGPRAQQRRHFSFLRCLLKKKKVFAEARSAALPRAHSYANIHTLAPQEVTPPPIYRWSDSTCLPYQPLTLCSG